MTPRVEPAETRVNYDAPAFMILWPHSCICGLPLDPPPHTLQIVAGSAMPGTGAGGDPPRFDRLLGGGPVLVLHAASARGRHDLETPAATVETAELVGKQFRAHRVLPVIDALANAASHDAATYPGLVLVLPDAFEVSDALIRIVAQVISDYRSRKPHGLTWLLANPDRTFPQAGVIQVIAQQAVLDDRRLAKALAKVCVRHPTDLHEAPFDIINPYLERPFTVVTPSAIPADVQADTMDTIAAYLSSWGITAIADVPRLRECVEDWRRKLENRNRYPSLARPIDGRPLNRLDFILGEPDYERSYSKKAWQEDGARVWRMVYGDLAQITPALARPKGRGNTKNAQLDLHELYSALCVLHDFMDTTDADQWPLLD